MTDWKKIAEEFGFSKVFSKRHIRVTHMAEEIARLREELKDTQAAASIHADEHRKSREEIARLRADFKFIEECSGKEYALLQKSRVANARLRSALETIAELNRPKKFGDKIYIHATPQGYTAKEALATADAHEEVDAHTIWACLMLSSADRQRELEVVREAVKRLDLDGINAARELRAAFGLGE